MHVTDARPETLSLAVPLIPIEGVLKAIVAPLLGEAIVSNGGVKSTLTMADEVALFPATSVTVPATVWAETS